MVSLNVKKWMKSLWHELTAYRSDRLLEVQDLRLGFFHKLCLLGAAAYLVYTVIVSHSYMKKESPNVSINAWVEGVENYQDLLKRYRRNGTLPWYCDSPATNYVYSEGFQYWNNTCDLDFFMGEITSLSSRAAQFLTYYQDRPEVNPNENEEVNAFIPEVEELVLVFSHSFSTSIGISGSNTMATLRAADGSSQQHFPAGSPIRIQLSELLKLTGVALNERNTDSGGSPPRDGRKWPLYRMTGVSLPFELAYENFRPSDPFDFTKELKIDVTAPRNTWTGAGRESFARWENGEYKAYERYSQVISITFDTAGVVGTPSAFEAVVSIAVTAAIFGVVKTIVDTIGTFVVREFYDMKTVDEADRQNIATAYEQARTYLAQRKQSKDAELKEENPIHVASQDLHRRSSTKEKGTRVPSPES